MVSHAKPAMQERSRQTRAALLDAMDKLLQAHEFTNITVAQLAAKANVSSASIYQRFANRDTLISILIELYMLKVEEWQSGASQGGLPVDLWQTMQVIGSRSWKMAEAIGYVMRPAYLQSRLRPDLLGTEWDRQLTRARDGFRQMLSQFAQELRGLEVEPVADALAFHSNTMLAGKLLHWPDPGLGNMPQDAEAYGAMVADFALGFIDRQAGKAGAS